MYEGALTSVSTHDGATDDFSIRIWLHQEPTLSPYIFTLVFYMRLTEHIQELTPRCILFTDDIVLLGVSREELNGGLETLTQALEAYDFRLSRRKTEYKEYNFNKMRSSFYFLPWRWKFEIILFLKLQSLNIFGP